MVQTHVVWQQKRTAVCKLQAIPALIQFPRIVIPLIHEPFVDGQHLAVVAKPKSGGARLSRIGGQRNNIRAMAVGQAPIHAVQRIPAKRVHGFLQPFARGRQIALSVGVFKLFSRIRGRVHEVEEGIQFRPLHAPVVRKSQRILPLKFRIGFVTDEVVEIHEGHLVVRLITRTRPRVGLRDENVLVVGVLFDQLSSSFRIFGVAGNVSGNLQVGQDGERIQTALLPPIGIVIQALRIENTPACRLAIEIDQMEIVIQQVIHDRAHLFADAELLFVSRGHQVVIQRVEKEMAVQLIRACIGFPVPLAIGAHGPARR